jgi:hypothetical protein
MSPVKTTKQTIGGSAQLSATSSASESADPAVKALTELEATVNSNARRYNEMKQLSDRKAEQLKQLQVRRVPSLRAAVAVFPS